VRSTVLVDPTVKTTYGDVRGSLENGLGIFKGIPFAAPLDGPRRFQAPLPPQPWEGVRAATSFSAAVPQPSRWPGMPTVWAPGDDTECLTVNVWTPDPAARLPVMVWIYGGAFLTGANSLPQYDGAILAGAGVVVVSLNYRVGFEGFGWLPGVPANRAYLDQLAALRWVRDNIARFGGDPDNVTIFGESAGATSVAGLSAAEAGRGLFRRGIGQSIAISLHAEEAAKEAAGRVAKELGVELSVEAFADVPSEAIHRTQGIFDGVNPYGPMLDGDLVRGHPWHEMRAEVDLIAGFNRDEFRLFTQVMKMRLRDPASLGLPPSALADYRAAHPELSEDGLAELITSDRVFRMPSLWCAQNHPGRAYLYELTWPSPVLGACHVLDVPLVFGTFDSPFATMLFGGPAPEEAETLSTQLRQAWISFATTGDPGWPQYTAAERLTRIWDVPVSVAADPEAVSRRIWAEAAAQRTPAT
jgi:para-nitrobenzyl esterase